MKKLLRVNYVLFVCSVIFQSACSTEDENAQPDEQQTTIELSSIDEGAGSIAVTGDQSYQFEGTARIDITGTRTVGQEPNAVSYNTAQYYVESETGYRMSVEVYWPMADGEEMPVGEYPIMALDMFSPSEEKFVSVSVSDDTFFFDTNNSSSGTATIANPSSDYFSMDFTFSANDLEDSFEDVSIQANGAAKFRLE